MLDGIHKIHLIGIGGSGMRAIANILIQKGYDVSGSDIAESAVISKFRDMGATVHIGHNKEYVNGVDAIVRSTAIREDNPEIVAAKEQGITILHRSDIVKAVLDVTDGIAVAGAHGKTSTTSMIGQILVEANADPTVIIGTSELARLFNLFSAAVYLTKGGMNFILETLWQSYNLWPSGNFNFPKLEPLFSYINNIMTHTIVYASPVIAVMLGGEAVLGLLARYASQLNAFAISLTVKSALAFLILIIYRYFIFLF